jgi:hypothetical protein
MTTTRRWMTYQCLIQPERFLLFLRVLPQILLHVGTREQTKIRTVKKTEKSKNKTK